MKVRVKLPQKPADGAEEMALVNYAIMEGIGRDLETRARAVFRSVRDPWKGTPPEVIITIKDLETPADFEVNGTDWVIVECARLMPRVFE